MTRCHNQRFNTSDDPGTPNPESAFQPSQRGGEAAEHEAWKKLYFLFPLMFLNVLEVSVPVFCASHAMLHGPRQGHRTKFWERIWQFY